MSSAGCCVINKCCANKCYSTYSSGASYGQFLYTRLSNSNTYMNQVLDSSIINSTPSGSNKYGTLYLDYAKISLNTVNLSYNTCSILPAFFCKPTYSSGTTTCYVTYCSIRGNNATDS